MTFSTEAIRTTHRHKHTHTYYASRNKAAAVTLKVNEGSQPTAALFMVKDQSEEQHTDQVWVDPILICTNS